MLFLFGAIFNVSNINYGYWNAGNYTLFLLIAYSIQYSKSITTVYEKLFKREKYWKTISGVLSAPVNIYILLLGTLIAEVILNSLPLIFLLVLAYFLYPINLFSLFLFIFLIFSIFIIFGAIGLIVGVFRLSYEEFNPYISLFLRFVFLLSCLNYPILIFPEFIQVFVLLNPLYYIFDLLRIIWLSGFNPTLALSYLSTIHIIITILVTIISPIISVILFNKIYDKYGITGY